MKYTRDYLTSPQYTDVNGFVRSAELWRFMQETACFHIKSAGLPLECLAENDRAFVISRVSIAFYEPVKPYENITVSTWARKGGAMRLPRDYRITVCGRTACEASSVWAVLRLSDRKLLRASDIPGELPFCTDSVSPSLEARMRFEQTENLIAVGSHTVGYADCDLYGHMNNTRYLDLVCEYLPFDGRTLSSVSLEYRHEAVRGSVISVFSESDASKCKYRFRGVSENGTVCFEASTLLRDL